MIQQINFDQPPKRSLKLAAPPTAAQRRLQYRHAKTLCKNAATPEALAIANRLAQSWLGCGCDDLDPPSQEYMEVCQPDQID